MDRDVFINKRGVFYTLERLRLKSNGLVDILISFYPNLCKANTCNHFHNILRLFDVLPSFPFSTNETLRDYYL